MRPLLSRLKPPRTLRALQQPNINATQTAIARTVTTATSPLRAEESLNDRLKRRLWGANAPTNTPPQVPPVEDVDVAETVTKAKQQLSGVDPTKVEGYVPQHDGRGLRVVGIVGKLGKKVEEVKVER